MQKTLLILIALAIWSCKKEDCEDTQTGTIIFVNELSVKIDIYLDGERVLSLNEKETSGTENIRAGRLQFELKEQGKGFFDTYLLEMPSCEFRTLIFK